MKIIGMIYSCECGFTSRMERAEAPKGYPWMLMCPDCGLALSSSADCETTNDSGVGPYEWAPRKDMDKEA